MVIWISIYFIGVFVCGLVQLYTQHLRLVGLDRRRWHHPPPERSRAKYGPPPARGGGLDSLFPENISGLLGKLVPGALREGLELEDLLLMLILYLMYRESGDKELLIVLGAMLFL